MNKQELEAEVARLKAENDKLKAPKPLTLKVSTKGTVSVYGIGRFPVSLYRTQMERLLDHADQIRQFIKDNEGTLAVKGEKKDEAA